MTKIWTENGFVDNDAWVMPGDDSADTGKPILVLDAFLEAVAVGTGKGLGVLIAPADDIRILEPHLGRIDLVALLFPAFSDGRAFSHASLLRGRLGYKGEVRAVGDVLIDQIPLMIRCGISSFAVTNATAIERLEQGRLPGLARHYQPAVKPAKAGQNYSWRRKAG